MVSPPARSPHKVGETTRVPIPKADRRLVAILAMVLMALSAAALSKPFHVDDTLFLRGGRAILDGHGPLGYRVNWLGIEEDAHRVMLNPPLAPALLAGLGALCGFEEASMHVLSVLGLGIFAWGTWRFATLARIDPAWVTLLACTAPAVAVSSGNVMPDVLCAGLMTLGMAEWGRAIATRSHAARGIALFALTAAALTKYVGVLAVVPCVAWSITREPRPARSAVFLAIPVLALFAYDRWQLAAYGTSALGFAGEHSIAATLEPEATPWHLLVSVVFLGGVGVCGWIAWLTGRGALVRIVLPAVTCGIALLTVATGAHSLAARYPATSSNGLGLPGIVWWEGLGFLVSGVLALELLVRECKVAAPTRPAVVAMCVCAAIHVCALNWSVSIRALLPLTPILCIAAVRALDVDRWPSRRFVLAAGIGLQVVVSAMLCWGDHEIARDARATAHSSVVGGNTKFVGHWGFQHYAEQAGARALQSTDAKPPSGTIVLVPMLNCLSTRVPKDWIAESVASSHRLHSPLIPLGPRSGAGYYASVLGPLPYGINREESSTVWSLLVK